MKNMKTRNGFVSNSSSASFVLDKHRLSGYQLERLRNHIQAGRDLKLPTMEYAEDRDAWEITKDDDNVLELFTIIDNFDMCELIDALGAEAAVIEKEGDNY
jgi:hypothetical protein